MHLLISILLLSGILCSFVSAGPSPQWLYQQIHALPDNGNDRETTEQHTKKSDIPYKKIDGVKRLFNFLDSAIKESGSGSGEGSGDEHVTLATKQPSGPHGLTGKDFATVATPVSPEKQKTVASDSLQQKTEAKETSVKGGQVLLNQRKTGAVSYGGEAATSLDNKSQTKYTTSNQQRGQTSTLPQRITGYMASAGLQTYSPNTSPYAGTMQSQKLTTGYSAADSPNTSPYARTMQSQTLTTGYSAAGQRAQSYGYTASRRRPPAIPVRSQVVANQALRAHPLVPAQHSIAGAPHRSNIGGPYYTTVTFTYPNQYGGYYRPLGVKSSEPLQGKAYGQVTRQRNHFHQQARALIPGRVPMAQPYNRYPYPAYHASVPGQTRGAIPFHFPYQHPRVVASRARMPAFPRVVNSPPNPASFPGQVYYRNAIPQQHASFTRNMHASTQRYGYPLTQRARIGRAVVNRKPQPRTLLTSLTAAAARLVVPARPEAYDNSATAESVWTSSAPQRSAHVVRRSNAHLRHV